jgi:hypothetical protein
MILGYYWHYPFLQWFGGALAYHIFTFVAYFFIYWFAFLSLKHIFKVREETALLVLLFLDVLPFNESKITAICSFYTMTLFFLSIGFYYLHRRTQKWKKVFGALCVLLSFLTPSLSFFYIMLLVVLFISENQWHFNLKDAWKNIRLGLYRYGIHGLVAIFSFIAYKIIFVPNQFHQEGYNAIRPNFIMNLPLNMLKVTYINGIEFYQQVKAIPMNMVLIGLLTMCFFLLLRRHSLISHRNLKPGLAGLFLWFTAMIPYIAVNKLPTFYEHLSRHQLLLPFGFALVFSSFIGWIPARVQKTALIISLAFFGTITLNQYRQYEMEDYKNKWLAYKFGATEDILNNQSFIIVDNANDFKSNENPNRFYSWAGLARNVFKTQNRFFGDSTEYEYMIGQTEKFATGEFNAKDYVAEELPDAYLEVRQTENWGHNRQWVYYLSNKYMSPELPSIKTLPLELKIKWPPK